MYRFTLSIILNKEMTHALMCEHQKLGKLNFIGGKIQDDETVLDASFRELFEETGISSDDVNLQVFRHEVVELYGKAKRPDSVYPDFDMYISIGVLNKEVELKEEKNPLVWIDLKDASTFIYANGDGQCYTYLIQGVKLLKDYGYQLPDYKDDEK